MPRIAATTFGLALVLATVACGAGGERSTLRVFAASSLTDAFVALEDTFEDEHRDVDVQLTFDGSSSLATQVIEGAPADVLATADEESYTRTLDARAAEDGLPFATNVLEVVAATGDERVQLLRDLARTDLVVVLCAVEVPCGRLADRLLESASIPVRAASREPNAQAVLTKVALGEADAGIAYATDVRNAGHAVRGVRIPPEQNVGTTYLIGRTTDTGVPILAGEWIAYVRSAEGRRVLDELGFGPS